MLEGTAKLDDVAVRPARAPRLQVITPGAGRSGALELQYEASRRMLANLPGTSRYVIIEAQSVGADADSFQLAEFADSVIMVVETDLTTRMDAADCLNRLDRLGTTVLGAAVVTASQRRRHPTRQATQGDPAALPEPKRRPLAVPRANGSARQSPAALTAGQPAAAASPDSFEETRPLSRITAMNRPDRASPAPDFTNPSDEAAGS